jgi:putative transcriptional regulator
MESKQQVINTIQEVRKQRGITQEALAEAVGVTRQTIISIEKGNYVPSVLLALKLAIFFNKRVEELFSISRETQLL